MADWRQDTDILRCNPKFFGHPRYDCAIFNAVPSDFFGRLVFMFTCVVGDRVEPIALIRPFDQPRRAPSQKDKDLGFYRVRERQRGTQTEFVSLHSIRRGALLVQDFQKSGDYLVHDTVDSDMFLRVRELKGEPDVQS